MKVVYIFGIIFLYWLNSNNLQVSVSASILRVVRATCTQGSIWTPPIAALNSLCYGCFCYNAAAGISICSLKFPVHSGCLTTITAATGGVITTAGTTVPTTTPSTTTTPLPTFATFPISFPNSGLPWWLNNGFPGVAAPATLPGSIPGAPPSFLG